MTHTKPLQAGEPFRMVFTITVGGRGVAVGGGFRIQSPQSSDAGRWQRLRWDYQTLRAATTRGDALVRAATCLGPVRPAQAEPHAIREDIYVTVHGSPLIEGDRVTLVIGDLGYDTSCQFARVQERAMDRAVWRVQVDERGDENFIEVATFAVTVQPGPTVETLARAPSVVEIGESFHVSLKAEDKHGNPSAPIEVIERTVNSKGVHRLEVKGARTNPISTRKRHGRYRVFWGDLHGHCSSGPFAYPPSHGVGTPDEYYEFARDAAALDFVALTEYTEADHDYRQAVARKFDDPGRFAAFFGVEWGGSRTRLKGHVHVIYADDHDIPLPPAKHVSDDPMRLIDSLRAHSVRALVIPHHTNAQRDHGLDFAKQVRRMFGEHLDHARTLRLEDEGWGPWTWWEPADDYLRLFEICQLRGSFELDRLEKGVLFAGYQASAQDALANGLRVGFVGGTDTHLGRPGDRDALQCLGEKRRGGMTAVLAEELTRESIFQALYERRCYATTFARILLEVEVNGQPMGSSLSVPRGGEVIISVAVHGTDRIARIEIVRNNVDVFHAAPNAKDASFEWSDLVSTSCWYYVRVTQADGEMAWSSPVWVDLSE